MHNVDGYQALTEKEKDTLRLLVAGHDAKSIARRLDLSIHTVNERLRVARRKMAVSSSREAARLLHAAEGGTPDFSADMPLGDAPSDTAVTVADTRSPRRHFRRQVAAGLIGGTALMSLAIALLALATTPQMPAPPSPVPPDAETVAADPTPSRAALQWLALVDAGQWTQSWAATGTAFRKLNTSMTWAKVSDEVRVPLGAVVSRTMVDDQDVPAPPHGFRMIRFRTSFANKPDTTETVTLAHEAERWKVVAYMIG